MLIRQCLLDSPDFNPEVLAPLAEISPQLLLVFGAVEFFRQPDCLARLSAALPGTALAGCSTAGEIHADCVYESTASLTALRFDHADFGIATTLLADMADSRAAGVRLAEQLKGKQIHNVLVFGQGVAINGSALIEGFRDVFASGVTLSGGLAGDGGAFSQTFVVSPDGVSDRSIVAIGFYGEHLQLHHGSFGGWQPFGPARKVTARILERHNIHAITAKDGLDAVAMLQTQVPDLAILDIEMPRMDGFEVVAHVRNQPYLRHLPYQTKQERH